MYNILPPLSTIALSEYKSLLNISSRKFELRHLSEIIVAPYHSNNFRFQRPTGTGISKFKAATNRSPWKSRTYAKYVPPFQVKYEWINSTLDLLSPVFLSGSSHCWRHVLASTTCGWTPCKDVNQSDSWPRWWEEGEAKRHF